MNCVSHKVVIKPIRNEPRKCGMNPLKMAENKDDKLIINDRLIRSLNNGMITKWRQNKVKFFNKF